MSDASDRDDDRVTVPPGACVGGRFDVVAHAGSGGVGSVYRAVERDTGRTVALKLLHAGSDGEARFAREAAVLASLEHPGIVRYLAFGEADGGASYLAMEWIDGLDLERRLRRGPVTPSEAVALARAVADALASAHARGVVHRDLKPANLVLVDGRFDAAKIVDFGLALPAEDVESLTDPGALLGTPSYMAPEQVRGERADARADLFALGAVLYRCLTGEAPFRGPNALAVLTKVLIEEPADLDARCPDAPPALRALVLRLLSKRPHERPADGAALARELAALHGADPDAPRRVAAVSDREERVASLVLSASRLRRAEHRPRPAAPRDEATLTAAGGAAPSGRFNVLREAIREAGGALELLAEGTRLVTVRGASPAEQAALAARCALTLATLRPHGAHVVATGRVLVAGPTQAGEVIDRAAARLTALRAQGLAAAGVHVDEGTADLLDDRFDVNGEGPWRRLAGARRGASGVRTVLGRATPCVGRARELDALSAALADVRAAPRARAVVVYGAPGQGKSRLVQEWLAREGAALGEGVLRAQAERSRTGAPFALVSQLVGDAAGVGPGDDAPTRGLRVRAMAERDVPAARAGAVAELLGEVSGAAAPWGEASEALRAARVDASLLADALSDAWVAWLMGRTARGAVALVVEDLHWGDAASVKLLDAALEALHDRPLLVVATARHEARETFPDLWARRAVEHVHLGPLPREAAEALVREALRGAVDDATVAAVVERSGAHPFHLEELVRAVGAGRSPDAVPDSVVAMIQSRIDHLDAESRRTLRAASVFGESFWPGGVAALLGAPATAYAVSARLAELIAREVVVRKTASRIVGETEYAFRHALVHDAAYATLPERDRADAHRAAGAWLERAGVADPAELAAHFERGGDPPRAARWLRLAAERSLHGNDLARAADLAARAAAATEDPALLGEARAVQSEAAFWRGEVDDAVRFAYEAAERLEPGGAAWFDAVAVAVSALGQRGRNDAVARLVVRTAEATSAPDARGAQLIALCRGLTQLYWAHHASDLRAVHARLYDLAQPLDALGPFHAGWVHRVHAEGLWIRAHDVDRSLAALDASCEAYERAGARRALCLTWINAASLQGWAGEFARSDELLARGAAEGRRLRAPFLQRYADAVGGLTAAWRGDPLAEPRIAEVLPSFRASPRVSYLLHVFAGGLALERGDVALAESRCREALSLAVADELRPAATALLARVFLARKARAQAAEVAREAVRVERTTRDLELTTGLADLTLAECLDACGDRAGAAAALEEAAGRLRALASRVASPERRRRLRARRLPHARVCELAALWGLAPVDGSDGAV